MAARTIHVAKTGSDLAEGTAEAPYLTICKAAREARPGDEVVVHEGTYREWVDPAFGGVGPYERISYRVAEGEHACIKGSEVVEGWQPDEEAGAGVWRAELPNALFGDFNPYDRYVWGDWVIDPPVPTRHLGAVYLDGQALFEASTLEEVARPRLREDGFAVKWERHREPIPHPERTLLVWHAEVGEDTTVIWANFGDADPREHLVEANVRESCFYPREAGKGWISVSGFEICQAATPFAPPTADQVGIIGPHWSRGWVIEGCDIHDAKCSAVSLGKDASTGDNEFTRSHRRPGYNYQFECVCRALAAGWTRETVGGHVVRDNKIHDCGQNAVVGHMGCAFSLICDNEIWNIATNHEFYGYEIAGIKLHAAIDTQIVHNDIHDCTLGIWLDWEACGTRVSRNVMHHNDRDLMIEVTHGPCLVDSNVLASGYALDNVAEGTAYVHNLIRGNMRRHRATNRSTPYHFPHSTKLLGSAFMFGGDDRWYNNVWVGGVENPNPDECACGTCAYDGHPASYEEYMERIESFFPGDHDHDIYFKVDQPVYVGHNVYLAGAQPFAAEASNVVSDEDPHMEVEVGAEGTWLSIDVPEEALAEPCELVDTELLGTTRTADAAYENPDGTPLACDVDLLGERRERIVAGPLAGLVAGHNRVRIW
ncbi:MAG: right-handed parallel beta-helix repeat-containing protein [Atopobiaceae bacterium]|jgi:hypothetical protein|nr:right-handed parallel beta-helix repeat-containing protein [Atopobiaceae bacterium]MCI1319029.1 right-handed parallel beta-helix repeat-containing protein [Atopobiaceae bacterium]MCI1389750.1 right-handed parallel beta-helix repeat-containing protein [Atopobiaceae bacterium]MCI1432712.1 right-handed parallel beta-helix repeat-containing protein [Atopobiaceae bacterium]MCI1470951.1 right-handed parallel beta-helix repeat-containing protein [Atopobiaceae bacterium]